MLSLETFQFDPTLVFTNITSIKPTKLHLISVSNTNA